ncbi:MAG TPA: hypothetical protein DDW52_27455 [Planctomycetaceae bacterium]|nr:hypothetical protein [Planctomycetaceae bacterium]
MADSSGKMQDVDQASRTAEKTQRPDGTEGGRTAVNLAVVSLASLLQLIIQFAITGVTASLYGSKAPADALYAALALPTFVTAVLSGSLSYILIPDLVAKFEADADGKAAWGLASFVGLVVSIAGIVAGIFLFGLAGPLVDYCYPNLKSPKTAYTCLEILSVQVFLTGLVSWTTAVHHSRQGFMWPALGGILGVTCSLLLVVFAGQRSVSVIAWAINLGSVVSVVVQLLPIAGKIAWPVADIANIAKLCRVFWPLILGTFYLRIEPVVDKLLADRLGDEGAVAHVNYSQRIMMALLTVGTSSLSLVVFPQLAKQFAAGGKIGFAKHFALALQRMWLIIVPIAIGVSCFALPIVRDLLERKQFTSEDTYVVGWLIVLSMGMFVGASLGELLARAFYVMEDTLTPTLVGAIALTIGFAFRFALIDSWGIWAIAAGVSVYFLLSAAVMLWMLRRKVGTGVLEGSFRQVRDAVIASLVACGVCAGVYATKIGTTWLAGPIGGIAYWVVLMLLKNEAALQIRHEIASRLRR